MQSRSKTAIFHRAAAACITLALLSAGIGSFAAKINPNMPSSITPAGQAAAREGIALQGGTLTSIKQVDYTDQGVETWILVQGTGNCNFTIETAGLAPQAFASSAAKPFPMKVKIAGAPLGSHQWTAKGTGTCTGTATATFSVNG